MASNNIIPTIIGPSQRALTELEKSDAPLAAQIAEACRILEVSESVVASADGCQREVERTTHLSASLGRDEWVLRWLLKSLKSEEKSGASIRAEARAWRLFRVLVHRIPLANTARLLNANKFLEVYEMCVCEAVEAEHRRSFWDVELDGAYASDSSSTVAESTAEHHSSQSRKRKRHGRSSGVDRSLERTSKDRSVKLWEQVHAAYSLLRSLLYMCNGADSHRYVMQESYEQEFMVSVLRSHPTAAADVLRHTLNLARILVELSSSQSPRATALADFSGLVDMLDAATEVWNYRSGLLDDENGVISNSTFASHCLVPALLLLEACYASTADEAGCRAITSRVDKLVVLHIILPARTFFFSSQRAESSAKDSTEDEGLKLLRELFVPLASGLSATDTGNLAVKLPFTALAASLLKSIPRLYLIAIRCPHPPAQDSVDNSLWLDAVLVTLANIAGIRTSSSDNGGLDHKQEQVLENLLQTAIDRRMKLDTSWLLAITICHSNIFRQGGSSPRWQLIAKVLKLDADVFLTASHDERIPEEARKLKNPLLETLFERITDAAVASACHTLLQDKDLIEHEILLPMLRELAKARALTNFFQHWHRGLVKLEEKRSAWLNVESDARITPVTLLERHSIGEALRDVLERSLTSDQIASELVDKLRFLQQPFGESAPQCREQFLASLVVTDGIIAGLTRDETIASLRQKFLFFGEAVLSGFQNGLAEDPRYWRLWKILTWIHTLWPDILQEFSEGSGSPLMKALKSTSAVFRKVRKIKKKSVAQSMAFLLAYESFHFVVTIVNVPSSVNDACRSQGLRVFSSLLAYLTKAILKTAKKIHKKNLRRHHKDDKKEKQPTWDGDPNKLKSRGTLAIALMSLLISQYPSTLAEVQPAIRRPFLQALYRATLLLPTSRDDFGPSSEITFRDLWQSVLESETILNIADVQSDIAKTLLPEGDREVEGDQSGGQPSSLSDLAVQSFLRLPLAVCPRKVRERALNLLIQNTLPATASEISQMTGRLGLMVKIMRAPSSTSILAARPQTIWELASRLDVPPLIGDAVLLSMFEELVYLLLGQLLSTADQERSCRFLAEYRKILVLTINQNRGWHASPALLCLAKISLKSLLGKSTPLTVSPSDNVALNIQRWLDTLGADIARVSAAPEEPGALIGWGPAELIWDAIAETPRLIDHLRIESGFKGIQAIIDRFQHIISQRYEENVPTAGRPGRRARQPVSLYKAVASMKACTAELVLQQLCPILDTDPYGGGRALSIVQTCICSLHAEERMKLLGALTGGMGVEHVEAGRLLCLRIALSVEDSDSSSSEARSQTSRVYRSLCKNMEMSTNVRHFRLVTDCMQSVLVTRKRALSQWDIEVTLAGVVMMASSHAPRLPPNFAGFVYARLCALVSALLTVHRIRLRSRYHVVLAVLQGLLRCLFVPHATVKGNNAGSAVPAPEALRPPWLGSGTFVSTTAAAAAAAARDSSGCLGPGQATAYAGLLTALCDPTVSSVAGGSGGARQHKLSKPDLTPATDRARRLAGQYLPYLLTEYAQWQLHSRLLPDVRAALLPGLYAIFAAAGPEMLRKVNASMDAASQEIFKTLYHDYQRFGR